MTAASTRVVALFGAVAALAVAASPAAAAVKIEQLVVFKDGDAQQDSVKVRATDVKVGGKKTCRVGSATPLAALALSEVPKLRVRDYGDCSTDRARDAGDLFVRSIGGDGNKGADGWVYKVRNRLASAGAADPTGPFGHGRLEKGARVTWFYCRLKAATHRCQKTLGVTPTVGTDETVHVHVTQYDDHGKRSPGAGAIVHVGAFEETADENGDADLVVPPGTYTVYAARPGAVRSFGKLVQSG